MFNTHTQPQTIRVNVLPDYFLENIKQVVNLKLKKGFQTSSPNDIGGPINDTTKNSCLSDKHAKLKLKE